MIYVGIIRVKEKDNVLLLIKLILNVHVVINLVIQLVIQVRIFFVDFY